MGILYNGDDIMPKKILIAIIIIITFLNSTVMATEKLEYAEIFDPTEGKIVKVVQLNARIRNMALNLIKNREGIRGKHNPVIVNDEYIMKVTLEPKIKVNRKWLNSNVKDVYIVFPEVGSPFFMYIKNEDNISCFPFNGNVDALYKTLTAN